MGIAKDQIRAELHAIAVRRSHTFALLLAGLVRQQSCCNAAQWASSTTTSGQECMDVQCVGGRCLLGLLLLLSEDRVAVMVFKVFLGRCIASGHTRRCKALIIRLCTLYCSDCLRTKLP